MKHQVDLPADIEQRLSAKASETNQDIPQLIRLAVARFVDADADAEPNGRWSENAQQRRLELIDKDIAGTITAAERVELVRLDRLANEHFDRVAPPPTEGARRLHQQLIKNRARQK
jgi:hypothetical protein